MKKHNSKILAYICLFCLLIFTPACIEEIETEGLTYEKLLVVDGNISNEVKAHKVHIYYTTPIINEGILPSIAVSGATVWVEDDLGNRTDFTEEDAGLYVSPDDFAGTIGRSYALFFTTREGKNFQSSFDKLVAAPEISNIYNQFSNASTDQTGTTEPGIQFFIDSENSGQSTQFYRYEWNDAHQIISPYPKKYNATPNAGGGYDITPFDGDVEECYRERHFNELILATSTSNANGQLREIPIKFSLASDFEVTTMYSIEVTQRAISPQAYTYYRKIELFNESNGSLFDKQQGLVVGNVISLEPDSEPVLGYFEVSGATNKRVFLNIRDLAPEVLPYIFRPCEKYPPLQFSGSLKDFYEANDVGEESKPSVQGQRLEYQLYDIDFTGNLLAHRLCVDCTRRGSLGKPDYWP